MFEAFAFSLIRSIQAIETNGQALVDMAINSINGANEHDREVRPDVEMQGEVVQFDEGLVQHPYPHAEVAALVMTGIVGLPVVMATHAAISATGAVRQIVSTIYQSTPISRALDAEREAERVRQVLAPQVDLSLDDVPEGYFEVWSTGDVNDPNVANRSFMVDQRREDTYGGMLMESARLSIIRIAVANLRMQFGIPKNTEPNRQMMRRHIMANTALFPGFSKASITEVYPYIELLALTPSKFELAAQQVLNPRPGLLAWLYRLGPGVDYPARLAELERLRGV